MIRENLFYKLLALSVAVVIWIYVNSERNPQSPPRTVTVPIEVRNLAKEYLADAKTREVNVTLSGLKTVVDSVRKEDIAAWIDLSKASKPGSSMFKVRARVSGVNENELDITIAPSKVDVEVAALGVKRLPVEVKYLAAPPLGYAYSDPTISPASIRVSGKSAQVARVKRVIVALPEQKSTKPINDYFPANPLDINGNIVSGVDMDYNKVRLTMEFVEVPATKAVLVSPNVSGEPKFPARVTRVLVSPSSVTLEGKPSALAGVSTIATDRLDIDGASETITRDVDLRLPSGVNVVGRGKVRVTVYISAPG